MLEKVAFKLMSKYLVGWKKVANKDSVIVDVYGVLPEIVALSFDRAEQKAYYTDLYKRLINLGKGDKELAELSPGSDLHRRKVENLRGQFFKNERFLYNGDKVKFNGTDLFNESGLVKIGIYYDLVRYAFAEMLSDKDRTIAQEKAKTFMVADAKNEVIKEVADMARRASNYDEALRKEIVEFGAADLKIENENDPQEVEGKISTFLAYLLDIALFLSAMSEYGSEARSTLSNVLSMLIISASNQDNKDYSANVIRNLQSSYGLDQEETDLIKNYCKAAYGKSEGEAAVIAGKLMSDLQSKGKRLGEFLKNSGEKYAPLKIKRDAKKIVLQVMSGKTLFDDATKNEKALNDLRDAFNISFNSLMENYGDEIEAEIEVDVDDNLITVREHRTLRSAMNRTFELNEGRADKFLEKQEEGSEMLDARREHREQFTGKELYQQMKEKDKEKFLSKLNKREEILLDYAKNLDLKKLVNAATKKDFEFVLQTPVFLIKNKNKIKSMVLSLAKKSNAYKGKLNEVEGILNNILGGLTSDEVEDNSPMPANDVEGLKEFSSKALDAQVGAKLSKIIKAIAIDAAKSK